MKMNGKELSQKQAGTLWTDIQAYFIELFEERPDLLTITISPEGLASDMQARFKGKYDPEAIVGLLKNGFENAAGNYVFKRTDFIKEPVKKEEAQS